MVAQELLKQAKGLVKRKDSDMYAVLDAFGARLDFSLKGKHGKNYIATGKTLGGAQYTYPRRELGIDHFTDTKYLEKNPIVLKAWSMINDNTRHYNKIYKYFDGYPVEELRVKKAKYLAFVVTAIKYAGVLVHEAYHVSDEYNSRSEMELNPGIGIASLEYRNKEDHMIELEERAWAYEAAFFKKIKKEEFQKDQMLEAPELEVIQSFLDYQIRRAENKKIDATYGSRW